MKQYSIRKSRVILRRAFHLFKKKGHKLTESEHKQFEGDLRSLDQAVLSGRKEDASTLAQRVESFVKTHFPKKALDHVRELVYALVFAIVVAFLIRQFWFELYEVPTGSMRPTVEELDRMVVSKTTFGVHVPFTKKLLFFSDKYLNRGGIIVFTVKDMDVHDQNMLYFGIFPGKKRYIKRAVAKPGDTVYFYGGLIYGVDKEGKATLDLADPQFLEKYGLSKIDHIPYITFEGKSEVKNAIAHGVYRSATLKQMNMPVVKMEAETQGKIEGTFFDGEQWIKDRPSLLKTPHDDPVSYSDLWGIGNYAMARLLTPEQVKKFYRDAPNESEEIPLYLELSHTPNLTYPAPEMRQDELGRIRPTLTPFTTILPLKMSHLKELQKNIYTSRFIIKDGGAYRYSEGRHRPQRKAYDPKFPGVPDGTYEFYYGKGYQIHFGGIRTALAEDHPLYKFSPEMIQKLFNIGIGFNIVFEPMAPIQPYNPQRFAYFRHGDLYIMGAPILKKSDPTLVKFTQKELEKQKSSTREEPYIAFVDRGPPLKENGDLDIAFIKTFGLKVPLDGVIGLGDNYAMSADSRDFGFVPVENLRGSPSFTFWPPGGRLGSLPQPPYSWVTFPNILIWTLVVIVAIVCSLMLKRKRRESLFKDD